MKEINLPDFEDLYELATQIHKRTMEARLLKVELDAQESEIFRTVSEDSKYFVGGKPPSAVYIKTAYLFSGLDGELLEKRKLLATLETEIENLKLVLDTHKLLIEVWRTQSANKRKAID